jgi:hypothetical protein
MDEGGSSFLGGSAEDIHNESYGVGFLLGRQLSEHVHTIRKVPNTVVRPGVVCITCNVLHRVLNNMPP